MKFAGVVEDVFEGLPAFGVAHPRAGNQFGSESYKPGVEEVLARTRSLLVGAGHRAGILHYGEAGYIRITRRLRSVNEGLSRAPNDLQERRRCDPTGGARPPPRWWRDFAGKTGYRSHGP